MTNPKEPIHEREVDVIYSPYEGMGGSNSSAVLSVDLEDLNNFTVCFAFMIDGLADNNPNLLKSIHNNNHMTSRC